MANSRVNIKISERFDSGISGDEPPESVFKFPPPPRLTPPTSTSDTSDSQSDVRWPRDPMTAPSSYKRRTRSATGSGINGGSGATIAQQVALCGARGGMGSPSFSVHRNGYQSDSCKDKHPSKLPPVGVFWDIENCQIPHGKSALTVVHAVRETFFEGFREAEFLVVCDVKKENSVIIQELNDAQVNVVHVNSTSKNAADDKLRLAIGRFADLHGTPSAVILISSDVNFAPDLSDLRYRKKIHVIVLHNNFCAEPLIKCANEHYNFCEFLHPLPYRAPLQNDYQVAHIVVTNLPTNLDEGKIKRRLKFLSQNCGGRIISVTGPKAILKFPNLEIASRAIKRMHGEIVYGNVIVASCHQVNNEDDRKEMTVREHPNDGSQSANIRSITATVPLRAQPSDTYFISDEESQLNNFQRTISFNNYWSTPNTKNKVNKGEAESPLATKLEKLPCTGYVGSQNYDIEINCSKEGAETCCPAKPGTNGYLKVQFLPRAIEAQLNENGRLLSDEPATQRESNPAIQEMDSTKYFHPIKQTNGTDRRTTIDLFIKNLDQSVDPSRMKKIISDLFSETITILNCTMYVERDGSYAAVVQVGLQDAQTAINRLNGVTIGHNKIEISCSPFPFSPITEDTRLQIKLLLQETPHCKMPLSKFQELLNYRASIRISTWDLSQLSDICLISNENGCDMISLPAKLMFSSKPIEAPIPDVVQTPRFEEGSLIKVNVIFSEFASKVDMMLTAFNGSIPFTSFYSLYCTMCGPLMLSEKGVPLEHLISCVDTVVLRSVKGVKSVQRSTSEDKSDGSSCDVSQSLSKLKTDVVEILKEQPHCVIPFSRFAVAYHHKFSQQIKLSDYGFSKLISLFEAIPCTAQVLGTGEARHVTLSHRAQVNRFASDLQTVLHRQPWKKAAVNRLPELFEANLNRPFDPLDYGLCYLLDLLYCVPKHWLEIKTGWNGMVVRWLRDDRSPEERERLKSFAIEILEVLKYQPSFSVRVDNFLSLYQNHFGQECAISEYGFSELEDLLDGLSDTVKVKPTDEGNLLVLTLEKKLQALNERVMQLVPPFRCLPLVSLASTYSWKYHAEIRPSEFNKPNLESLIRQLPSVKIVEDGKSVALVEFAVRKNMGSIVKKILINSIDGQVSQELITTRFSSYPEEYLKIQNVARLLPDAAKLVDNGSGPPLLEVTPLYQFVRQLVSLLNQFNGRLLIDSFEDNFYNVYNKRIQPNIFGFSSIVGLLKSLSDVVTLYGNGPSRQVVLKDGLTYQESPLTKKFAENQERHPKCSTPHSASFCPICKLWRPYSPLLNLQGSDGNGDFANNSVLQDYLPRPPDPSELPLPNHRLYASPADNDRSSHTVRDGRSTVSSSDSSSCIFTSKNTLGQKRCKGRLAAQFQQPFDLN